MKMKSSLRLKHLNKFIPLLPLLIVTAGAAVVGVGGHAYGQTFVAPVKSAMTAQSSIAAFIAGSETSYNADDSDTDVDVKRSVFGAQFDMPFTADIGFNGQLGLIFDSEFDPGNGSGDGFTLGGGLNGTIYAKDKLSMGAYGMLNYTSETYKEESQNFDMQVVDLEVGALASYALTQEFYPFAGLQFAPYSDGKVKGGGAESDFERNNHLQIRLGARYKMEPVNIGLDVLVMNDSLYSLSLAYPF